MHEHEHEHEHVNVDVGRSRQCPLTKHVVVDVLVLVVVDGFDIPVARQNGRACSCLTARGGGLP